MKTLDLTKLSKYHIQREINTVCGGYLIENKWFNGFNAGVGGMTFTDDMGGNSKGTYNVILTCYKKGIGLYFRNAHSNYLVLMSKEKIKSINIVKEKDIIKPMRVSIFSLLVKAGLAPEKVTGYLAPKEIITENPAYCIIKTDDYFIRLQFKKATPQKLLSMLKKSDFAEYLHENIHNPEILTS